MDRLKDAKPEAPGVDFGESFAMGATDPIHGGAQLLAHALPDRVVSAVNDATAYVNDLPVIGPITESLGMTPATPKQLDQALAERERGYREKRGPDAGFDYGRLAGNIAGSAPIALAVPGGGIGAATASGALLGGMQPVTEDGDFATQKALQVGLGAGGGAAGGAVVRGASRLIFPRKEVADLTSQGVRPTVGQIVGGPVKALEEKATSIPLLGDVIAGAHRGTIREFNKAAYNAVLRPIGKTFKGDVGRSGVDDVAKVLSSEYKALLPNVRFKVDQPFATKINDLLGAAREGMPAPQAAAFERHLKNKLFARLSQTGEMDGLTLKGVESELSRIARGLRKDQSFDNRELGTAISEVLSAVRQSLVRANPDQAGKLQAINAAYAAFARVRDAASRSGTDGGIFTPAQLQAAVRAGDSSVGKGQFARGGAMLQGLSEAGKSTLGRTYPDSGTAGRLGIGATAAGGLAYVNPTAAALTAASTVPYAPGARQALAYALARRPDMLKGPAALVDALTPLGGPLGSGAANQIP